MKQTSAQDANHYPTVVHLACQLILNSPSKDRLRKGVLLRVVVLSPYKAVVYWYDQMGADRQSPSPTFQPFQNILSDELYIVDHTINPLLYFWRKNRFGSGLYLRPYRTNERVSSEIELVKYREMLIELKT
jgi:hypothetical protein